MKASAKSLLASRLVLDGLGRGSFFILTLYLARRLGTSSFGTLAYALSLAQIFYVFTDLGLQLQMMADPRSHHSSDGSHRWVSYYKIKMVLLALTFVGGSVIGFFIWKISAPYWVFTAGLLWMSGNSIFDFQQSVCNSVGDMKAAQQILFLQRGLFLVVLVPVLWTHPTLGTAAFSLAGMSLLSSLVSHIFLMKTLKGDFSKESLPWKSVLLASLPNALGSAFYFWGLRASVVLLAWESSKEAVGAYAASVRIFEMSYVIPAAVMSIGLPHLSIAIAEGNVFFWNRWKRYAALMATTGLCWALGFLFLSGWVVKILFGVAYEGAIPSMRLLGITGGLVIVNHLFNHTMVAVGRQRRLAVTFACGFVLCLLLCMILIPKMEAVGAALAILLTEVALSLAVGLYIAVHRRTLIPILKT